MASSGHKSTSPSSDPLSSISFLPFSRTERIEINLEINALKRSNLSTCSGKITPVSNLDSLLRGDEYTLEKLFFPLDALKYCTLPFSPILSTSSIFTCLVPCQISPEMHVILMAMHTASHRSSLKLPQLTLEDFFGCYFLTPLSNSHTLFFCPAPRNNSNFAQL